MNRTRPTARAGQRCRVRTQLACCLRAQIWILLGVGQQYAEGGFASVAGASERAHRKLEPRALLGDDASGERLDAGLGRLVERGQARARIERIDERILSAITSRPLRAGPRGSRRSAFRSALRLDRARARPLLLAASVP